jgi:hypothetical protein
MREILGTIGILLICGLSLYETFAQSLTRRMEMYQAPEELHASVGILAAHPPSDTPCADKLIGLYPILKVTMPGSRIDGLILSASICDGGVWRPLPVQTQ